MVARQIAMPGMMTSARPGSRQGSRARAAAPRAPPPASAPAHAGRAGRLDRQAWRAWLRVIELDAATVEFKRVWNVVADQYVPAFRDFVERTEDLLLRTGLWRVMQMETPPRRTAA